MESHVTHFLLGVNPLWLTLGGNDTSYIISRRGGSYSRRYEPRRVEVMTKKLKAIEIARWFINRADRAAGEAITHLKVQKLLYFSDAYHMANFKSIFDEQFQAWAHGPVVAEVWHEFKSYQWDAIETQPAAKIKDNDLLNYLEAVYEKFGKLGAKRLEEITHEHAPWRDVRGNLPLEAKCSAIIRKETIRDFYANRINKQWNGQPIH